MDRRQFLLNARIFKSNFFDEFKSLAIIKRLIQIGSKGLQRHRGNTHSDYYNYERQFQTLTYEIYLKRWKRYAGTMMPEKMSALCWRNIVRKLHPYIISVMEASLAIESLTKTTKQILGRVLPSILPIRLLKHNLPSCNNPFSLKLMGTYYSRIRRLTLTCLKNWKSSFFPKNSLYMHPKCLILSTFLAPETIVRLGGVSSATQM